MHRTASARLALVALVVLLVEVSVAPSAGAAAGDLDPSFDGDGTATTRISLPTRRNPNLRFAEGVVVQTDGMIVAAGSVGNRFALARYRSDGALDPAFSGGSHPTPGIVTTVFLGGHARGSALALQGDGKIVVAGGVSDIATGESQFALARYRADGTLDPTFSGNGKLTTSLGGALARAEGVVIQPDGSIVAAGWSFDGSDTDFALARYRSNGTPDPSFGGDGIVTTGFPGHASISAVALQDDGKIVVAGGAADEFALARYRSNGSLDPAFGSDGRVTTAFDENGMGDPGSVCPSWGDRLAREVQSCATSVAIQDDGKVVAAGGVGGDTIFALRFALARYDATGALDLSFSEDGKVTTRFGGRLLYAAGVAIHDDGKIVAAGHGVGVSGGSRFALARYRVGGTLDPGFGSGGVVINDSIDRAAATAAGDVTLQANGKIVAAGGGTRGFVLARYLP